MAQDVAAVTALRPAVATDVSAGGDGAPGRDPRPGQDSSRYRLIIEEGPGNAYVYKTLDRVTGEVVRQFPREQVLKFMSDPTYDPGQVFGARI
jgi:flagellar protein FlaG